MATNSTTAPTTKSVLISAPNFGRAIFFIGGPVLVVHRFSAKTKAEMKAKAEAGKTAASRKVREPKDTQNIYEEARYISPQGWEGFHAASIRNAMISACRLVSFKMTLAKLSIFVEADGVDEKEPQIPLIRIYGKPQLAGRHGTRGDRSAIRDCAGCLPRLEGAGDYSMGPRSVHAF